MEFRALHLTALLFLFVMLTTCYATNTIYLEYFCNQNYIVYKDVRIKLLHSSYRTQDFNCTMTLKPSSGSRLTARFQSYSQGDINIFGNTCGQQAIFLNQFFGTNGYCAILKPSDNYNLGTQGTYRYFVKVPILTVKVADANLIVTEVTDKTGDACPSGFFDCEKDNACIDNDLTCNGYDDCGNDRDEIEGCGLTTGIIVGIVFGIIGFIAIIVIGAVIYLKCR